jgi:hypothetical protein
MARDSVGESLTFDELHDEKARARGFLEAVERSDVRMVHGREKTRLALEPGKPLGVVLDIFRENLDGDVAPEPRIARPVDDPHSPGTELVQDLVMGESRSDHRPTAAENTRYSSMTPTLPKWLVSTTGPSRKPTSTACRATTPVQNLLDKLLACAEVRLPETVERQSEIREAALGGIGEDSKRSQNREVQFLSLAAPVSVIH